MYIYIRIYIYMYICYVYIFTVYLDEVGHEELDIKRYTKVALTISDIYIYTYIHLYVYIL